MAEKKSKKKEVFEPPEWLKATGVPETILSINKSIAELVKPPARPTTSYSDMMRSQSPWGPIITLPSKEDIASGKAAERLIASRDVVVEKKKPTPDKSRMILSPEIIRPATQTALQGAMAPINLLFAARPKADEHINPDALQELAEYTRYPMAKYLNPETPEPPPLSFFELSKGRNPLIRTLAFAGDIAIPGPGELAAVGKAAKVVKVSKDYMPLTKVVEGFGKKVNENTRLPALAKIFEHPELPEVERIDILKTFEDELARIEVDNVIVRPSPQKITENYYSWKENILPKKYVPVVTAKEEKAMRETLASQRKAEKYAAKPRPLMKIVEDYEGPMSTKLQQVARAFDSGQFRALGKTDEEVLRVVENVIHFTKDEGLGKAFSKWKEKELPFREIPKVEPPTGEMVSHATQEAPTLAERVVETGKAVAEATKTAEARQATIEAAKSRWARNKEVVARFVTSRISSDIAPLGEVGGKRLYEQAKQGLGSRQKWETAAVFGAPEHMFDPVHGVTNIVTDEAGNIKFDRTPALDHIIEPIARLTNDVKEMGKLYDSVGLLSWARQAKVMINSQLKNPGMTLQQADKIIAGVEKLPEAQKVALKEASDRLHDGYNWIVDYAVKSRRLSPMDAERMKSENPYYTSLMRDIVEEDLGKRRGGGLFVRRWGGNENVINPLETYGQRLISGGSGIDKNTFRRHAVYKMMEKGGRNEDSALNWIHEVEARSGPQLWKDLETGKITRDSDMPTDLVPVWDVDPKTGETVRRVFRIDDPILRDAVKRKPLELAGAARVADATFHGINNVLKAGVTNLPAFGLFNVARDTPAGKILDPNIGLGQLPGAVVDTVIGAPGRMKDVWQEAPALLALRWMGGGGGEFFARDVNNHIGVLMAKQAIDKAAHKKLFVSFKAKNPIEYMRKVNLMLENFNRFEAAQRVLDKGGDWRKAALMMRERSTDFGELGTWTRWVNRYFPFSGASVGGHRTWIRMLANPKTRYQTILKGTLLVTLPMLGLHELHTRLKHKWYQELSPEEKIGYFHITRDIRFPIPFDLGTIFGSLPVAIAERAEQGARGEVTETWPQEIGVALKQSRFPISQPLVNIARGMDSGKDPYTGWDINPRYSEGKAEHEKQTNATPEFMKAMAETAPDVFDTMRVSPAEVNFMARSMFAQAYNEFANAGDLALNIANKDWAEINYGDVPIAGPAVARFWPQDLDRRYGTRYTRFFFKQNEKDRNYFSTLTSAVKEGNEKEVNKLIREHKPELKYYNRRGKAWAREIENMNKIYQGARQKDPYKLAKALGNEGFAGEIKKWPAEKFIKIEKSSIKKIQKLTQGYTLDRNDSIEKIKAGKDIEELE